LLQQLNNFSSYHPDLQAMLQRLQAVQIELKDIADEVDRLGGQVNYDPTRIEELNERLSLGYKLQKKHGVNSTNELLAIHQHLKEKLQVVHDIGYMIAEKEAATIKLGEEVTKLAARITESRRKQMKPLEERVNKLLIKVGMPNARLKVILENIAPQQWGADHIEFLFDANASGNFQPVRKVASGGELSRLMLCIKSLVAQSIELPTMIFDEIDTGISGEAARQVGLIMKELAASRQVICITHQPQIAGKADAHYFVYKETVKKAVTTNIRTLTSEERIMAIAKMLSGEEPTAAAMENAREMVRN
jgi:DNA repair protein RecN (Recombination protein N)